MYAVLLIKASPPMMAASFDDGSTLINPLRIVALEHFSDEIRGPAHQASQQP
jgi:hypothetical protein